MHDYSIDKHPKEKILFTLALAAITVAPWINQGVTMVLGRFGYATGLWPSTVITAVPVFSIFLGIYWLFNNKLWKVRWLRSRLLIPDLNGVWSLDGLSILRRGETVNYPWAGEVRITQSWTKILIHLRTSQSSSKSVSASISQEPGIGYRLLYNYTNNPDADQLELRRHDGSADILFTADCLGGEGHYFTDQNRLTVGKMGLTKR